MAIKINDIPPEGLSFAVSQAIDLFDEGQASVPVAASLTVFSAGNGVLRVTGSLRAEPQLECSRCLKRFPFRIEDKALQVELAPRAVLADAAEHELKRAELDVEFYDGDEIDPLGMLKEQLLLAIPMVPVHREDCKGLCSVCGTDLNETTCSCNKETGGPQGPFSKLKDLLNAKKE